MTELTADRALADTPLDRGPVVVTGGASGLGAAVVRAVQAAGGTPVVLDLADPGDGTEAVAVLIIQNQMCLITFYRRHISVDCGKISSDWFVPELLRKIVGKILTPEDVSSTRIDFIPHDF